MELKLERVGQ